MSTSKVWRITVTMLAAVLVFASFAGGVSAATDQAPVAQELRAQEVKGTIPGGQSAEIWLGLDTVTPGEKITIVSTWDQFDPRANGLGFYVLTDQNKTEVLNGTDPRLANLATGSRLSPESPENEVGAEFQATSDFFTLIVYNDSPSDANFTLSAENAFITDGSGQVEDVNAAPEMDETMADETMADDTEATGEGDTTAAAEDTAASETGADTTTEAVEATPEPVDEAAATPVATDEPEAVAEATPAPVGTPGVVEAQELEGELPEQNDQHFLGLEPSVKDGTITLVMAYNPQDSSELARRIGFWVLDRDAFNRFLNANENVVLSQVAVAAGSGDQPGLASNERSASFTASGFGPYTVVAYNNSSVPATYTLRVDGGILIDDSGQTTTAMQTVEAGETMTGTMESESGTATSDASTATGAEEPDAAETETGATPGREGDPGGTYTVQSGDTLSLIARDIYGEVGYWEDLCSFNNLSDCNAIEVGAVLELPTLDQLGTGATAPAASEETAPAATATPAAEEADTGTVADTEDSTSTTTRQPAASTTGTVTTTTGVTSTTDVSATDEMTDTAETEAEAETPSVDILSMLEAEGGMTIFVEALKAASLDDTLMKDPGPFTIFAPTDAAFEATLPNYEDLFGNPAGTLTELLLYHIVSDSELTTADIADGMEAATAHQALPVKFEVTDDGLKVQDSVITKADIMASNGVIDIIDKVMIPSDISQ